MFEIVLDLVEAFFWYKIFLLRTQVAAVDDSVDKCVWQVVWVSATLDTADVFEAEWVSDSD